MISLHSMRRKLWTYLLAVILFCLVLSYCNIPVTSRAHQAEGVSAALGDDDTQSVWRRLQPYHPVSSMRPLPTGKPLSLPKVQRRFGKESATACKVRLERQAVVKDTFTRCWNSYRARAWMSDELTPVSGSRRDPFGGWGATLVDSLDTLWIMGMRHEFDEAAAAAVNITFDETTPLGEINVFETNIRYLGGFLSAYDLSGDKRLLRKAREVGDMLYVAFDTPNRMPITRWDLHAAARGEDQVAHENVLVAEMGTFTLEFFRLSLLTGDGKWFDAAQRIMDVFYEQQNTTQLPGMWPIVVNAKKQQFNQHNDFTLGAMADSLFEYLPKTHALLGGLLPMYREMYEAAMHTAAKYNLFRPMLPDEKNVLVSGMVGTSRTESGTVTELRPDGQHLVCFAGGMFALGGKLTQNDDHVGLGEKLVDGCVWTYQAMPLAIMPETFNMLPCPNRDHCAWDERKWKEEVLKKAGEQASDLDKADVVIAQKRLPKGFTSIGDTRYILRPEAIESVFVLYRITGRTDLLESAWAMFQAIESNTRTELANSALNDVTVAKDPSMSDSMESFWMGETLKYFYLIFSEPDLVSLDEYVFNTEAHPLKRLLP
ncbi:glycoside hydrolase [Diplogelasinospora grovesii]|uniref:alpha-1,2-Mannosidase n=1 Tax=Diplogelasinospora grovesii TaxID=303347 RepID=A0AAN6N8A0_9PEZI|nr:glycoside hydrolase [Diplogelasinospora grovesii]